MTADRYQASGDVLEALGHDHDRRTRFSRQLAHAVSVRQIPLPVDVVTRQGFRKG